jgi:hypothetical protein
VTTKKEVAALYRLRVGYGAWDDYEIVRASKSHRCTHGWTHGQKLKTECIHPVIESGDWYLRTRQSWLEWDPLALSCALAEGILIRTEAPR